MVLLAALTPAFVVLCALLAMAGAHKVLVPQGARDSVALVGISAPDLVIRALGALELGIGVVAAVWPSAVTTTLVAAAYAAFAGFVLRLLVQHPGKRVDCGCFGGTASDTGWLHVALNAIACGVASASAAVGAHGIGWILSRSAPTVPPLIVGMLAATYAAYLAYTLVPRAWASYGSGPGP